MANTQEQSWSDDPNAPKISPTVYFEEKASFAGILIASMLYGTRGNFSLPVCLSTFALFVLYSRGSYRGVFPMHGRAA